MRMMRMIGAGLALVAMSGISLATEGVVTTTIGPDANINVNVNIAKYASVTAPTSVTVDVDSAGAAYTNATAADVVVKANTGVNVKLTAGAMTLKDYADADATSIGGQAMGTALFAWNASLTGATLKSGLGVATDALADVDTTNALAVAAGEHTLPLNVGVKTKALGATGVKAGSYPGAAVLTVTVTAQS